MPSYQDYFNAYLGVGASSKAAEKQQNVAQASQNKRTSLSGTDPNMAYQAMIGMETERGATTSSELERDLVSLTPFELQMKYGDAAAAEMLRNRNSGRQQLNSDRTAPRSWGEFFGDTALSAGLGFANSLGGIAALGAGLIDEDAGVAVSKFMDDSTRAFRNNLQSDGMAAARRINSAKAALDNRDSQAAYEADKAGGSDTLAKFKRVGREAIGSIARSTEDGTIFGDELANAAGSLFAAGPIAKPISAAGTALVNGATKLGIASGAISAASTGAGRAFQVAQKVGAGAGVPVAIGLMEGGGAYQQTVMEVMAMKPEELAANSPRYQELLAQNIDPLEAQKIVANEAGLEAGKIQAPIGVATGMLVNRFEGNPLRFRAGNTIANTGKEGVEEGIQGATGTLASNYAIQDTADRNRDISQGVGEQLGTGALFGAGSAAAVRAPIDAAAVAADTALVTMRGAKVGLDIAAAGAKAVGGPIYQALIKRGDEILQRNAERSVVSEEAAAAATQQAADLAGQADVELKAAIDETALDDETKQKGFNYVDQLMQAVVWDDAEVSDPAIPERIRSTLAGSANRFDAINRLTDLVDQSEPGSQEQLDAATALYEMLAQNQELTDNQLVDALSELPDDHPTMPLLKTFEDALVRIQSTPKVIRALAESHNIARAAQESGLLEPIADTEIGTPQGDQKLRNTLAVASHAPLEANPDANDKLLYHAEQGDISLTPMQRAQLRVSSSLVRAERERLAQIEALGLTTNSDVVSGEILVDDAPSKEKYKSAAAHIKGVIAFMKAGETEAAQIALQEFLLFAQHMQNKVAALNEHLKTGEGLSKKAVRYEQLVPGAGRFRPSSQALYVNPNAPKTVQFAQTVGNDAQTVGKLANDLVDVFPELGVQKVELVPLDPYLTDGTADEIKAKFQAELKARKNGQQQEVQAEVQPEAEQAPVTEAAPEQAPETTPETAPETQPVDEVVVEEKPVENVVEPVEQNQPEAETQVQETQPEGTDETQNTQSDQPVETAPEPAETGQSEGGDQSVASEVEQEVQPQAVDPKPAGLGVLFGSLIDASLLDKIFQFSKDAKTRILGTGSPLAVLTEVLASRDDLVSFTADSEKPLNRDYTDETAEAYAAFLDDAQLIKQGMLSRLAQFLKQPYSQKEPSKGTNQDQLLAEGSALTRYARGKALNIVEQQEDGSLTYNEELLEAAVLAAMQWLLTAENYQASLDKEDVAGILGVAESDVPAWLTGKLNEGLGLIEAKRSLATKIQEYWGLSAKNNIGIGLSEGIFEAIAAELLSSMVDAGALKMELVEVKDLPEVGDRNLYIFQPTLAEDSPLYDFPQAIDTAVLVNPEPATFIGSPPSKVAPTQLRNPEVKHTKKQQKAISFEQQTPHFINVPMMDFVLSMGVKNIIDLFGAGDTDSVPMNKQDRTSKEGLNRSLSMAYRSINQLIREVRSFAAVSRDGQVDQVPVFYDYVFTRVNRMQMLGANNPQANKLMREVVMPTRATIDLSDPQSQQFSDFVLALAQGLGVKVHTMSRAEANKKVLAKLENPAELKPAVDMLRERLENGDTQKPLTDEQMAILKQALGKKASVVSLHAVMEYARYKNAGDNELKAFTTSLYVEADGVTNGPVNAMQLITPGRFTPTWIKTMIKGGLNFGPVATTMNYIREFLDGEDLYTATTTALTRFRAEFLKEIGLNDEMVQHEKKLAFLLQTFIKDITLNEAGELVFDRGVAKNPLTITIYGSGARGIAGNIVDELTTAIYEKMTAALQRHEADNSLTPAEAMFPDDAPADAELKFKKVMVALQSLNQNVLTRDRKELVMTGGVGGPLTDFDFTEFEFSRDNRENLIDNVLTMFVEPLRKGIEETIGKDTMAAAEVMRQAVQVQSIALQYAFQAKVAEKLKLKKLDPDWVQEDFLSHQELKAILDELRPLAPMIQTVDQGYYIVGSESANLNDTEFGSALPLKDAPKFRTKGQVRGPGDAGVAGIPSLIIGFGDGQMMLELSTMDQAPTGTLKVFDGMHIKLDSLNEDSQKANEAVFRSWMGNPLLQLLTSFEEFLGAYDASAATAAELQAMRKSLGLRTGDAGLVAASIRGLQDKLTSMALEIEARHRAMARVSLSVDQMASVGAPYQHTGEISLEGLGAEEIAQVLNGLAREEYVKLLAERQSEAEAKAEAAKGEVSEDIAAELASVGRVVKPGLREISYTALKNLARKLNIPANQKELLNDVLKTLAARDYTVVFGDPALVEGYASSRGFALPGTIEGTVNGFISVDDRRIYLFKPSSETLVHELLHAATFDKIAAYFDGQDLGANGIEQVRAIERLQELQKQFLELDVTQESSEIQLAYLNAVEAIEQAETEAIALNEFMAWGLANAQLAKLLEKTKASPLVQLARNVVEAIKKLIWGRRKSPAVADDMLSNLRFNTGILMQSKANVMDRFARTIMFHNTAYGNNDRVAEFNEALKQKIFRYISNKLGTVEPKIKERLVRKELKNLATMTDMALWVEQAGFDLTTQERTTLNLVVATMMTAAELDANVLTAVQDMFVHVSKTLKVEDFMADPNSLNPNERIRAERKYNMVLGNMQRDSDFMGRSSVLPVFLGLAVVSDEFRSVLAKLPMPEKNRKVGTSIDVRLDNMANAALEGLSDLFSGNRRNSPDVQVAMDLLVQKLLDTVEEREGAMQQIVSSTGNMIDQANDWIVDQMQSLAERAFDAATEKKNTSNSKLMQTASSLVIGLSGIVNERVNAKVAEGLMASMNRLDLWQPIQDLVSDLVGRTESNAPIFDMIKRARNMVQRARQQFREHLPEVLENKFTRKLTEDEWSELFHGLGKTDIAVLRDSMSPADLRDVLSNERRLRREIRNREAELQRLSPNYAMDIQVKAYQLARFINTGEAGSFLLRNAHAVAGLYGRNLPDHEYGQDLVDVVDELVSLYAFEGISDGAKVTIASLAQDQAEGLEFVIEYLVGQRNDEMIKSQQGQARPNYYKGYMPTEHKGGMSLIVAQDDQQSRLEAMSYVRVGDYTGSSLDRSGVSRGYYMLKAPGRAAFSQGIFQNVHMTAYGVDPHTGYSREMTAGRITDPGTVKQITRRIANERLTNEPLMPVFDDAGQVIAYERAVDPAQKEVLGGGTNLAKVIGIWRGRQLEENMGNRVNAMLVQRLHDMWADETQSGTNTEKMKEYVNVFSPAEMKKDPVLKAARDLLTTDTLMNIAGTFPQEFWVRRDMLKDAMGYHMASVGDLWTGTSRFSDPVLAGAQKALIGVFGLNAYRYMVNAEKILQNIVTEARILIVVKSVVVPVTNLMANIYQLWARGVPMAQIVNGMPRKAAEVNAYLQSRLKLDELEAELRSVSNDVLASQKLEAQMRTIRDSHKRLSIWPLIEAGEFSSISDGTITHEEMTLTEGRVSEYIEKFVDRLPPSVRNLGRYAVISRDTSLFKGLQRAVEYGDFLAKAVLYDELTKRKGLSQEETLARITEEFVNYDRLPGRGRGYLESMGLLWFYNFKIRSTKVALSMIRNNPLHALLAMGAPHPDMIGSVGLPIEDNVLTLGAQGDLNWSMGPGMGLRSHELNPWVSLIN